MNPKLPYGWSPKGERIKIFPRRDKKINLFGIFRPDNFCLTYESAENINSDFLIRSIDDFSSYLEKPTVLVLDNAPTHRSEKFLAAVERWMEKGLYIFFLPKYSPHLNLAETFWRKAKYEWLRPADYGSFAKFKKKVRAIFNNIGLEYKIQFHQMIVEFNIVGVLIFQMIKNFPVVMFLTKRNCRPDDGNSVFDRSCYTCAMPPSTARSTPVM